MMLGVVLHNRKTRQEPQHKQFSVTFPLPPLIFVRYLPWYLLVDLNSLILLTHSPRSPSHFWTIFLHQSPTMGISQKTISHILNLTKAKEIKGLCCPNRISKMFYFYCDHTSYCNTFDSSSYHTDWFFCFTLDSFTPKQKRWATKKIKITRPLAGLKR